MGPFDVTFGEGVRPVQGYEGFGSFRCWGIRDVERVVFQGRLGLYLRLLRGLKLESFGLVRSSICKETPCLSNSQTEDPK